MTTSDDEEAGGLRAAVQTALSGGQVAQLYRFKGALLGDGRGDVTVVVIGEDRADCVAIYDAIDLGIEAGRAPRSSAVAPGVKLLPIGSDLSALREHYSSADAAAILSNAHVKFVHIDGTKPASFNVVGRMREDAPSVLAFLQRITETQLSAGELELALQVGREMAARIDEPSVFDYIASLRHQPTLDGFATRLERAFDIRGR